MHKRMKLAATLIGMAVVVVWVIGDRTPRGKRPRISMRCPSVVLICPVDGGCGEDRITSEFGWRRHPIKGMRAFHTGVDLRGVRIHAVADGVVEGIRFDADGYGLYVRIRHDFKRWNGRTARYMSWYAHMRSTAEGLRTGQAVKQGETIGFVGQSGLATGPHLHMGLQHRLTGGGAGTPALWAWVNPMACIVREGEIMVDTPGARSGMGGRSHGD